jgi:hypothetical protein
MQVGGFMLEHWLEQASGRGTQGEQIGGRLWDLSSVSELLCQAREIFDWRT